jgi:dCTP deaminase
MAEKDKMIEPFAREQVRQADGHKIVSYGTSSYGYDVRCSREFKIFTNINSTIVDPEELRREELRRCTRGRLHHPAELLRAGAAPWNISASRVRRSSCVLGKSTYARCGIIVNVTPLEPEWEGHVTLGVLEHHAAAREDLRQRRRGADAVLRVGRGVFDVVQGSRREVPGPDGRDAAEDVKRGMSPFIGGLRTGSGA